MTRSRAGGAAVVVVGVEAASMEEVAAGSTAAACMPDVSTLAVVIVAACARHIPLQAALDMVAVTQSPVAPVTATGAGIIVVDTVRQRR